MGGGDLQRHLARLLPLQDVSAGLFPMGRVDGAPPPAHTHPGHNGQTSLARRLCWSAHDGKQQVVRDLAAWKLVAFKN